MRFLVGEELVSFYESTPGTHRGFCKVCGALVLVKFDKHSRSAQTDPGAVALYGVVLERSQQETPLDALIVGIRSRK